MKYRAYAKVNLGLDVASKREDGYHELKSVMVPIQLHDLIEIHVSEQMHFECVPNFLIHPDKNTLLKMIEVCRAKFNFTENFYIRLYKHIPSQAGLGGGSSDAAAILNYLDKYFKWNLSDQEKIDLAVQVGADVPFCLFEKPALVKGIGENSKLSLEELKEVQHFTQPPAHFTEASLVKALEELGIGRPSTYAPTISTIIARHYIAKEQKNLYVTELGKAVNDSMMKAFPQIVDVNFTANMESLLDGVADGDVKWKELIKNFYPDLKESVDKAEKDLENVKIEDEVTDVICDQCGRNMVIKYGPHGKFLGCPGFPECHNTKPYLEKIGVACPKCGKDIILKKTKKGRMFYGCEGYPECDFMSWQRPSDKKCPKCGGIMLIKGNKLVCANEECGYILDTAKNDN